MTMPGLAGKFEALQAVIPYEGNVGDFDNAAHELSQLSLRDVKRLQFYGLGRIFAQVAPRIPYFENPDSSEFRELVAQEYIEQGKFVKDEWRKFTIIELARSSLQIVLADAINDGVHAAGQGVCATVRALDNEPSTRDDDNTLESRRLKLTPMLDNKDIEQNISANIFGASDLLLASLLEACGYDPDYISPRAFRVLAPTLRSLLSDDKTGVVLHRHANIDLYTFKDLFFKHRALTGWMHVTLDQRYSVDADYRPPVHEPVTEGTTAFRPAAHTFMQIPVGCPARYVKGAINWAPQALLTGCIAVAEAGPMPVRSRLDGTLHYVN